MRYRCKICGTPGEGKTFPVSCPACGSSEFEKRPFDAKCPKCGQGFFKEDNPIICAACGNRLKAPPVVPKPKLNRPTVSPLPGKRTVSPPKPVPTPRRRPVTTPSPKSPTVRHAPHSGGSGDGAVLNVLKFIGWLVLCFVAGYIGYHVIMMLWDVLCFIGRHWIISLIVFFFIVGSMDKS